MSWKESLNGEGNNMNYFLDEESFLEELFFLTMLYERGGKWHGKEPLRRIRAGVEVAWQQIDEANYIADLLIDEPGSWFCGIKERINALRPGNVFSGELVCVDGRLGRWFRLPPRIMSSFTTPGALLESKPDIDGRPTLMGSEVLATSTESLVQEGLVLLELTGPHHSLRHGADAHHPLGCGAFGAWLRNKGYKGPLEFPDGGVALDLVREERQLSERLVSYKGAQVVRRIIDTDTQGMVFIGDGLYSTIKGEVEKDDYLLLTLEEVQNRHQDKGSQGLLYTPELALEMRGFLEKDKWFYGTIDWNSLDTLADNIAYCVDLTEVIMNSSWGRKIEERLDELYGAEFRRGFRNKSKDMIRELAVQVAYNVAVIWLSGFIDEENVPERFKHHGERYGVIGDKGFDYWIMTAPFLLAASETPEQVHQNLDVVMSLLPGILESVHGVYLDEEAMVLFVTGVLDTTGSQEARGRSLAALRERYHLKMLHLQKKNLLSLGRVLLIPLMVDEKTRRPLFVPDFRSKFGV